MAPSSVSRLLLVALAVAAVTSVAGQTCSCCTEKCRDIVHNRAQNKGRGSCPYPPEDPTYSYFLFVLQWPGTFCSSDKACCDQGKFPQGVDWTIHGLWPEKSQNCYPYCCDLDSVRFSHKAVASLPDLTTYWPTLACNTDDYFHGNEWDKHGTCALEALEAQSSDPVHYYFQRTLELREALPLAKILSDQGIVPSDDRTYSSADIIEAVRSHTKTRPDLNCKGANLNEVHFCIDTDLQTYIDCPTRDELAAAAMSDLLTRGHGGGGHGGGQGGGSGSGRCHAQKGCPDTISIPNVRVDVAAVQ